MYYTMTPYEHISWLFEAGSGQLAQMFANGCHFLSAEERFDKAALPR